MKARPDGVTADLLPGIGFICRFLDSIMKGIVSVWGEA
jgi:hypothetical protein